MNQKAMAAAGLMVLGFGFVWMAGHPWTGLRERPGPARVITLPPTMPVYVPPVTTDTWENTDAVKASDE